MASNVDFGKTIEKIFKGDAEIKEIIPFVANAMDMAYELQMQTGQAMLNNDFKDTEEVKMSNLSNLYKISSGNWGTYMKEFALKTKKIDEIPDETESEILDWKKKALEMNAAKAEFEKLKKKVPE